MVPFNFDEGPFIVIWEVTRACGLACRHCRAEAQLRRHPLELNSEEALRTVEQVARAKPNLFVLTGGDPIQRPDLLPIIDHASDLGLRVGLSPSATPLFGQFDLKELKRRGVARISLSIDGASRASHDQFRGVPGTWDLTMQAIRKAAEAELPVQINTTFTRQNIGEFDAFVGLLEKIRPVLWSVFQLVPTGRGRLDDLLNGAEMEELFQKLWRLSQTVPYDIKTTEGQHYRRVALQNTGDARPLRQRAPMGINDGKGFVFISHLGDICPSGFLPIAAGNVRKEELVEVYRNSPLFRALRQPNQLKGKCGRCEFRTICGGSRARAYAMTGDYLAEEPLCVYEPGSRESGEARKEDSLASSAARTTGSLG